MLARVGQLSGFTQSFNSGNRNSLSLFLNDFCFGSEVGVVGRLCAVTKFARAFPVNRHHYWKEPTTEPMFGDWFALKP